MKGPIALAGSVTILGLQLLSACADTEDRACTLLACQDGLTVSLDAASWPAGKYVFELTGDGKTARCEGTLPLATCEGPGLTCTGDLEATVTVVGCALPAGQQAFGSIQLPQGAARVSVSIARHGAPVANGSFQPTYAITRPNGPGCGPECRSASAVLRLEP